MFKKAGGLPMLVVQVVSLDSSILEEQALLPIMYQCIQSDYRGEMTTIDLLTLLSLLKSPSYRGNLTRRQHSGEIARSLDFASALFSHAHSEQ